MLFSRQCSQTSAGVWHRARPQQRPGVHEGGPLAGEAGDTCRNPFFLCHSYFVALPQDKNQHLTAPYRRRRLECSCLARRRGRIGDAVLARHTFLAVSTPFSALLQATLQTIFTPFFVVQFHVFPSCVAVPFVVFVMGAANCITCKCSWISQLFSVFVWLCLLETMRWPADASCSRVTAPRRRLVRRVVFPAARGAQPSENEDLLGNR